jgi:hypothetical protein
MLMSTLSAAHVFVRAFNTMQLEWNKGAARKGFNVDKAGVKVILAYGITIPIPLSYL